MIKSFVRGQSLQIAQPLVVTGTLNYIEMKVDFKTSDWDGLSKWVHFRNESGEEIPPQNLNSDNMLTKDNEIDLTTGVWTVWIHGTSPSEDGLEVTRITTNEATITVENTGMKGDHPLPPVAPEISEQLDSKIQNAVKVSNEAKQTADDALKKVQEVSPMVDDAKKYAEFAKKSADNAKTSETNSKTSETNSKISETNSKISETNAKTSASESANSEAKASIYAQSAEKSFMNSAESARKAGLSEANAEKSSFRSKTSETNAKTSETNSKTSETNAKTSETNSKTSETNAKTFEISAKNSADNAKTFEISAKKSADNAKTSESKVATDASAAALAAKNAKVSEDNAKNSEDNAKVSEDNSKTSEENAGASETNAADSEKKAMQALQDLLKMLGTDIATLVNGKIPADQIPSIATTEIFVCESQEEQDAIKGAERGDILIRTDKAKSYIWKDTGWVYLVSPTDYAAKAGYAETAGTAENSNKINGHRMVEMSKEQFDTAVKDFTTYYLVHDPRAEV